jgi:hypothetical protein
MGRGDAAVQVRGLIVEKAFANVERDLFARFCIIPVNRMSEFTELQAGSAVRGLRLGIFAGFVACLSYPLAAFVPLPMRATAAIAACFGPALALACFGLKGLLDVEKRTISSALGLLLNALAGALFSAMALVQIAVGSLVKDGKVLLTMNGI